VEPPSRLELPALTCLGIDPGVAEPDAERRARLEPPRRPECAPAFLVQIEEGAVWTPGFLPFLPSGDYLVDAVRTPRLLSLAGLSVDADLAIENLPEPVDRPESVILLGNAQGENHFHWLFESLARLGILREAIEGEPRDARYLVPHLSEAQVESLRSAGVDRDRLLTVEESFVRFRRVYVPSRGIERIDRFNRAAIAFLQSMGGDGRPWRRVYLTRRGARRRRVVNEDELMRALSRSGFEEVPSDRLTFAEQLRLFSETATLVAPHGAGLANMVFMPPGGSVLELQPEGQNAAGTLMYRCLAALAGQRYGVYVGAAGAGREAIQVDPTELASQAADLS
jgi:capsular polysaccharide biosynthesis protein